LKNWHPAQSGCSSQIMWKCVSRPPFLSLNSHCHPSFCDWTTIQLQLRSSNWHHMHSDGKKKVSCLPITTSFHPKRNIFSAVKLKCNCFATKTMALYVAESNALTCTQHGKKGGRRACSSKECTTYMSSGVKQPSSRSITAETNYWTLWSTNKKDKVDNNIVYYYTFEDVAIIPSADALDCVWTIHSSMQ